ncbi:MAG: glutathione S-transferase family protein [Steroidobacteraceae bacterium]
MKLFGSIASPYVARVVLAARMKGLELPIATPPGGSIKTAEYAVVNPLGKMPALTDQGRHLAESQVICEYIDDIVPEPPLRPADAYGRARVSLLARIADLYLMNGFGPLFRNMNPAKRNPTEVQSALEVFEKNKSCLEHFMEPGPFAFGKTLTLADCAMYPSLTTTGLVLVSYGITDQLKGCARLSQWWSSMEQHPVAGPLGAEHRDALLALMKSFAS